MALKISVSLQKKVGLPDYGSLAAACHVEFESGISVLTDSLEPFQQQVHRAYAACAQAVNDELARQSSQQLQDRKHQNAGNHGNGNGNGNNGNDNGARSERRATQSQSRAIRAIASRQGKDLGSFLHSRFGVDAPEALSIGHASQLIDELKRGVAGDVAGGRA